MDNLKKYAKYILLIIAGYLLTHFLIFIALNSEYKAIQLVQNLPEQIVIDKAEATKIQGRIYGNVQNNENKNLNGKQIKISIINSNNENIATEYLKIENLGINEKKAFKCNFNAKEAKSYEINIVDLNE